MTAEMNVLIFSFRLNLLSWWRRCPAGPEEDCSIASGHGKSKWSFTLRHQSWTHADARLVVRKRKCHQWRRLSYTHWSVSKYNVLQSLSVYWPRLSSVIKVDIRWCLYAITRSRSVDSCPRLVRVLFADRTQLVIILIAGTDTSSVSQFLWIGFWTEILCCLYTRKMSLKFSNSIMSIICSPTIKLCRRLSATYHLALMKWSCTWSLCVICQELVAAKSLQLNTKKTEVMWLSSATNVSKLSPGERYLQGGAVSCNPRPRLDRWLWAHDEVT